MKATCFRETVDTAHLNARLFRQIASADDPDSPSQSCVQGRTDEELMIFHAWDDPKDTKFAGIFMDFWDKLKMVVAQVSNWQQGYDEWNVWASISDNLSDRVVKVISSWFVYISRLGQNLLKIPTLYGYLRSMPLCSTNIFCYVLWSVIAENVYTVYPFENRHGTPKWQFPPGIWSSKSMFPVPCWWVTTFGEKTSPTIFIQVQNRLLYEGWTPARSCL